VLSYCGQTLGLINKLINSVSPLLTPIDVLAYQHSILTLDFDEISDVVFHYGRVWFMWHIRPRTAEREKIPNSLGRIGLGSCEIDESGKLCNLKRWPLPLPPACVPRDAKPLPPEYKIASIVGNSLIVLLTIKYDRPNSLSAAQTVVLSFSPVTERWHLGAYGSATKKFRFHAIETPADISYDKFSAATVSSTIVIYTHGDDVYGGFDDTQYQRDDWKRTPEIERMLDLSFFQKMEVLLPHAAPFIFLNSNVPWDEQITDPPGGKAVFLPAFGNRVILIHNYEPIIVKTDRRIEQAEAVRYKFKWPGLAIEREEHYDVVFALTHDIDADWSNALVGFRVPTAVIEQSGMVHDCKKDIFSCVAGFCPNR
jgi:hypothetical protein